MYIYDIPKNEKITIILDTGKDCEDIELSAKILFSSLKGNCTFVSFADNQNFQLSLHDKREVSVIYISKKNPVIFYNCILQYIQYNNSNYYVLSCKNIGMSRNRRNCIRIPINETASVILGSKTIDAEIKDVSTNGFAFISDQDISYYTDYVVVLYHDIIVEEDIRLVGKITRIKKEAGNKILYGCCMKPRAVIDEYIDLRQKRTSYT